MEYNDYNHNYELNPAQADQVPAPEQKNGKKKIKMPFGAVIACMLSLALVVGLAFASVKLIGSGIENVRGMVSINGSSSGSNGSDQNDQSSELSDIIQQSDNTGSLSYASSFVPSDSEYQTIQSCMDSVVSIDVMVRSGFSNVTASSGSGVIVTEDGYIATCNHVVESADKIYVYLNNGSSYEAKLIGRDVLNDLAVIKIEETGLTYATFGDSSTLKIGESVFAIGNALGVLSNTYTTGVISGLDRVLEVEDQKMTLLQTDAAVNHGNSGGGLFRKADGTLIGIVNAKSAGSDIDGLGFAIPSKVVGTIIQDLIDYGYVSGRPYLGVSTSDITLSGYGFFTSYYTYPQITAIETGSPADNSELREGDIILSVDGVTVSGTDSLERVLNNHSIGDTITLTVLRDRTSIDIRITLSERSGQIN